jgi:hypothetical protein
MQIREEFYMGASFGGVGFIALARPSDRVMSDNDRERFVHPAWVWTNDEKPTTSSPGRFA